MRRLSSLPIHGLAAPVLAALVAAPLGAQAEEPPTVAELEYQDARRWDVLLPEEGWAPVRERIVLAGWEFVVERPDRGKLLVDTDADGETDERVTGSKGFVRLKVRDGDTTFRYALRLRKNGQEWEWITGCMRSGRIGGVPVRLVDLDGNGTFNDFGKDAMVVGRGTTAIYLSRVIPLDGTLHELDVDVQGSRATVTPYEGPVATIDVRSGFVSQGTLVAAIFRGDDVCFDAASGKQGAVLVPAGEYRLRSGLAERNGETARLSAGRMGMVRLDDGDERVLEWGGPLHAEFSYDVQDGQITVRPDVRYFGSLGEEYGGFAPVSAAPRVFVQDKATGKLVQVGNLGGCCGGGYSAYKGSVPQGLEFEVTLRHNRGLFGPIAGVGRQRTRTGVADR